MEKKKYNCSMCQNRRICEIGMGEEPDSNDCQNYVPNEPREIYY